MDTSKFIRQGKMVWDVPAQGAMHVPAVIYASEELVHEMDDKVYEQLCNVTKLPDIVKAAYAMPDAHWGYGFPIGGVAAFNADHVACLRNDTSLPASMCRARAQRRQQRFWTEPGGNGPGGRIGVVVGPPRPLAQGTTPARAACAARWPLQGAYRLAGRYCTQADSHAVRTPCSALALHPTRPIRKRCYE